MNVAIGVLLNLLLVQHVYSSCIMFGECHYDSEREKLKNCYYEEGTKLAEPLNKTDEDYEAALTQLRSYCSYYFYDDEGNEKSATIENPSDAPLTRGLFRSGRHRTVLQRWSNIDDGGRSHHGCSVCPLPNLSQELH